ncbi:uncharacterized protein LOC132902796 [Amyelois transitella]|uniref:uncharacterized protein LOC132902796 n=1 Tax=Amyelois transitella TaxID=680683 RepID=UPI0029906D1C|nr:uncharacterized protein LOC132902796 [Amyelois transitella]
MKRVIVLLLSHIYMNCAFFIPYGILKLSCQDSALLIDRIVVKPDGTQSTHTGKIIARSLENQILDLKQKSNDKINDLVYNEVAPKHSNVNERSFVYLKQKHRTPIINLVHGTNDGLTKSNAEQLATMKEYFHDFTKKLAQYPIEKYLQDYSIFNQDPNETVTRRFSKLKLGNPRKDYRKDNMNDIDPNLYEKLKIVEFLKPPLLRYEHNSETKRNEISQTTQHTSLERYDTHVYPTRSNQHLHINNNLKGTIYVKPRENETLCSHIYHSHIKECVQRIFGKNVNQSAFNILTKCLRELCLREYKNK